MQNKMSDSGESCKDVQTRKRYSMVWQYFERLSSVRVKCRICQHEQRFMGNTANALRHLKSKHDIDARPVGLSDPENVKRMKALSTSGIPFEPTFTNTNVKNECNLYDEDDQHNEDKSKDEENSERIRRCRRNRASVLLCDNENDVDPYGNNEEPLVDFVDTNKYDNIKDDEDETYNLNRNFKSHSSRKRSSLEDERIKAETEYFREKAAYFRIQKHLTALQAKKVKFELEQLYAK